MSARTVLKSFGSIGQWMGRHRQRLRHQKTLNHYKAGAFNCLHPTIGVAQALDAEVLDPQYLRGDTLLKMAPDLDSRVWDAWNESCRNRMDAYKRFYGVDEEGLKTRFSSVYTSLLPFEQLIDLANQKNNLALLQWLHQLNTPWRAIQWLPGKLVGEHRGIGQWALDTFPNAGLAPDDAQALACHLLFEPRHRPNNATTVPSAWISTSSKKAFSLAAWDDNPAEQQRMHAYALRLFNVLLPPQEWTWQHRWNFIGKNMPWAVDSTGEHKQQLRCSMHTGALLSALLHEAPVDIQIALCAFKRGRHPHENHHDYPDAQFIRHHFFAETLSEIPVSSILSTVFLFVQSVDPDVEVDFVLEQLVHHASCPETLALDNIELDNVL